MVLWEIPGLRYHLRSNEAVTGQHTAASSPPGSKCSSAEARPQPPVPLFSSNLRGSERQLGSKDAKKHMALVTEPPLQMGTHSNTSAARPPGGVPAGTSPASPAYPSEHSSQQSAFQKVHMQKSLFFSTIFSFSQKKESKR